MGTNRRIALALLASSAFCSAAFAQSAPNQKFIQVDENGVDLTTGYFFWSMTEGTIGSGEGALEWNRYWSGPGGWRDSWTGALFTKTEGGTPITHVEMGPIGDTFTCSGGICTNTKANGATLSGGVYTSADGITISFISAGPDLGYPLTGQYPCQIADPGTCAIPVSVHRPNGMTFTIGWDILERCLQFDPELNCISPAAYFRLRTVTSSGNYKLTVNYATDTALPANQPPPPDWYKRTNIQFTNLASPPSPLPTVTYTQVSSTVTDVTDIGGRTWRLTNGSAGNLSGIRRPGAVSDTTTIAYAGGLVSSVTNEGVTKTYSRSVVGNTGTMTVTDPLTNTRAITSDLTIGRPTSFRDELIRTTSFQYDSNGRLTRTTLPEGNYTQLTYDGRGNVTEVRRVAKSGSGLADIIASASYDATCANIVTCNKPNSTTDARNNVTDYTYNSAHGGVLTVTQPAPTIGAVRPQVRYDYTQVTAVTGQPVWLLTSTSACQTLSSCNGAADETKTTVTYNTTNLLPTSSSSGNGTGTLTATTTNTYDSIGNLSTVDGPLAGTADTTKSRYNSARQIIGITSPDPDGAGALKMRSVRNTYTNALLTKVELGTVNSQSDADWALFATLQTTDVTYDSNARVTQRKLSASGTAYALTQTSYDSLGRLDCSAVRMNTAAYGSLPASACTLSTQSGFGPDRIRQIVYDAASQVSQQKFAIGTTDAAIERTLTYSNNGVATSLLDAESNKTTYVYDGFDRLSQTQFPNTIKGSGTSNASDYEQLGYDAASNVTSRRLRDGTSIFFTFDNLNRVTLKDLPGTDPDVTIGYDNLNRVTAMSQPGYAMSFGYDALSRQTAENQGFGNITRSFDLAGRMTKTTWWDGFFVDYDRLVTGEITKVGENGATSGVGVLATYGYDNLGNRTSLTFGNGASQAFTYDPVLRLASLTNDLSGTANDLSATLAYNPASQVASTTRTGDTYAWTGHGNGSTAYTSNGLNQQVTIGGGAATWDDRKNLTTDPTTAKTYTYWSHNQLKSASGGVTLYYDPLLRLAEYDTAVSTRFVHDGAQVAAEVDNPAGAIQKRYVWGDGPDELIVQYTGSGTTNRQFMSADERGSIISLTDSAGALVAINRYDEFGKPQTGNVGRFQYTGQSWLSEAGVYDYKARAYLPHLGIFAQTDPIGYAGGANLYAYTLNSPVNLTDSGGTYAATDSFLDESGTGQMVPGAAGLEGFNFQWEGVAITHVGGRIDEIMLNSATAQLNLMSARSGWSVECLLTCPMDWLYQFQNGAGNPFGASLAQPGRGDVASHFAPLTPGEQALMNRLLGSPEFHQRTGEAWNYTAINGLEHGFFIWLLPSSQFKLGTIFTGTCDVRGCSMGYKFAAAAAFYSQNGGFWATFHTHPGTWPGAAGPSCCQLFGSDIGFNQLYHSIGIIGSRWGIPSAYGH